MKSLFILLLLLFSLVSSFISQNSTIDSLSSKLDITIEDSVQAELLNDVAFELVNLSLYKEAKEHYTSLLNVSMKINYKKGIWAYWSGMATILLNENKLDEALESYFELEKQMKKGKADSANLGVLYASIANVYDAKSLYNHSVEYHTKALSLFQKVKNKPYEAVVLGNLGSIYFKSKDYESSIQFHEKSLIIKKEISSDYSIGTGYFNYAQVYDRLKNYQKTIDLLNISISYLEKCNDQAGVALCYTSLGLCYVSLSDSLEGKSVNLLTKEGSLLLSKKELLSKAFNYELMAITIFESLNENYQIGHAYNGIGTVLINQNRPEKAIEYYKKAYDKFKNTKLETAKAATEGLAEGYKDLKQYDLAYQWQKEMLRIQKEIDGNTNPIELGKQQANIIYQQDKEIEELKHERELVTANLASIKRENMIKSERDSRNKLLFVAGALLLLVIGLFFFVRRSLQAKNDLLTASEKVKSSTIQLLELENKQTTLLSSIEGEEKERERIALELHDGVASALTGVRLKMSTGRLTETELGQNLKEINEEIRSISHQLAIPSLKDIGIAELFFEQLISNAFSKIEVDLSCFPEGDLLPFNAQEKKSVYRIVQELFQNISKHAKATQVMVSYSNSEDEVNIIIEDNGLGFNVDENKKGIGFDNIQKRLLSLNGKFSLDSSPGRGTCAIIQIKKV
jgi:signal transduction histidine kinase